MTAINEIPDAFALQSQLMLIETAVAGLEAGAVVAGVSVSHLIGPPESELRQETRVSFSPPIDDQGAINDIVTMLNGQRDRLIKALQALGFTYTGTALPPEKPVTQRLTADHTRLMQTTPPPPSLPPAPLIEPPAVSAPSDEPPPLLSIPTQPVLPPEPPVA
jgi:hypothetical protein